MYFLQYAFGGSQAAEVIQSWPEPEDIIVYCVKGHISYSVF